MLPAWACHPELDEGAHVASRHPEPLSGEEMTARDPYFCRLRGRLVSDRFISSMSLRGGPRL
jgi:hypothetical protein